MFKSSYRIVIGTASKGLRLVVGYWSVFVSVVIIMFSGFRVVGATGQNVVYGAEDCVRLVGTCAFMSDQAARKVTTYKSFSSYEITDYAHYVTYKIELQGELEATTDTAEFSRLIAETLGDARGWVQAGYVFSSTGLATNADFKLILIQAELLNNVPGCDSNWSCRSGVNVYINEDRWNGGTAAWNAAGGNLRDYRHMVVNHEVGHWLGHGHYSCSDGENGLAPVMQQQSIDLQGCSFNPWPLAFELEAV